MKKITLFALAALLVLLTGCKKENKLDPQQEVKKQIVEALDYAQPFFGKDSADVVTQLVDDGWAFAGDDTTIVYSKINDHNISMQFTLQSEEGVINAVRMSLIDKNANSTLLGVNAFKECMSYVGENPTIAGMSMSFTCMMYYMDGDAAMEKEFSDALDAIIDAYNEKYVGVLWTEQSSMTTLLLSKYIDEKLGVPCVNIVIG